MGRVYPHNKSPIFGFLLVFIMLFASLNSGNLSEIDESSNAQSRQSLEVDCSNYSFEELFVYDYATYDVVFGNNWQSGWIVASAYVNDSNAATVREDLDGLLEGLPGGNDGFISTDEREAVRQVGPDCIEDMETKMGIREGIPHRGGVDWNDLDWVGDGIALDEKDLVPEDHPEERNCQGAWASSDCKEVPVHITDNLEIHLLADTDNSDKNVEMNQLPNKGNSNYTFVMNTTNVTQATLTVTFPAVNGLRIANWDLYRDGVSHTENVSNEPQQSINSAGSLIMVWEASYDLIDWPLIQELFVDFTTDPLESNEPPEWSSSAPANDTIIPIVNDGTEVVMLTANQIDNFVVDEGDVQMTCNGPSSWSFQTSSDGDLMVTPGSGDSASVSCNGVDQDMLTSEEQRTWTVAQPVTLDGVTESTQAMITVTPTAVSSPSVILKGVQGARETVTAGVHDFTGSAEIILDLSPLSPGSFLVEATVTASGMLDWTATIDLGLSKISQPPSVTVQKKSDGENGTWDSSGYSYSMSGTFYEPDSETVEFSIEVCGYTTTSINQMGANWDATVSVAGCTNHDSYTITITVTDASGSTSESVVVALPPGGDGGSDSGGGGAISTEDSGGLPAPGVAFAIIGLALAAIARRRD